MSNNMPRESSTELAKKLDDATKQVSVGARYKHYKQKYYKVIGLGLFEETNEPCVIYKAEYDPKLTFIRPLINWLETVRWKGEMVERFVIQTD